MKDWERIGVLWKPRNAQGKYKLTGKLSFTNDSGEKIEMKIGLRKNDRQREGKRDPDYELIMFPDDSGSKEAREHNGSSTPTQTSGGW